MAESEEADEVHTQVAADGTSVEPPLFTTSPPADEGVGDQRCPVASAATRYEDSFICGHVAGSKSDPASVGPMPRPYQADEG